jgi:hypothetical protein
MSDSYEREMLNNIEALLKNDIKSLINGRILLLNVSKKLDPILNMLGKFDSKIVGLGESDEVYDLPFYWRIKYVKGKLSEIRFPHSLFDGILFFIDSRTRSSNHISIELARISKPKTKLYLILLDKMALEEKEAYVKLLSDNFELMGDEKNILVLYNKKQENKRFVNTIYVYHPNLAKDGITEYAKHLIYRLKKRGFKVLEGLPQTEDENDFILVEFEELLSYTNKFRKLEELPKNSYIEIHSKTLPKFRKDLIYLYHGIPSHYGIDFSRISWYYVPHIAYEIEFSESERIFDYCSFGFWSPFKRFDQIRKLKGRKKLVMSFNYLISDDKFVKEQCKKRLSYPLNIICNTPLVSSKNLKRLIKLKYAMLRLFNVKVIIKDYIPYEELVRELSECKAFVFFQETDAPSSGSMRLAAAFGVPVYAKDNLRAKDSQVIRYKRLNEIDQLPKDKINIDDGLDYIISLIQYIS